MSNDLTTTEGRELAEHEPQNTSAQVFQGRQSLGAGANIGAIAVEQERAIAETQGKMVLAKRFPRSRQEAKAEFIDSCKDKHFAETAIYAVPNRGSGPSIRFAEEAARCYGNFDFGHRELSRMPGVNGAAGTSEIEVYAWDMERNNFSRRQITIRHSVDTKQGPKILRDEADIDNRIANVASKQVRGRILALLPKDLVAAGIDQVKKTLAGQAGDKPIATRISDMIQAFAKYGVTPAHIAERLGHKVDDITVDELTDLRGVITALKEGGKVSEYFGPSEDKSEGEGAPITGAKAEPKTPPKAQDKKPAEQKPGEQKPAEEKPKEADKPPAAETQPKDADPRLDPDTPAAQQKPAEAEKPAPAATVAEKSPEPAQQPAAAEGGDGGPDLF